MTAANHVGRRTHSRSRIGAIGAILTEVRHSMLSNDWTVSGGGALISCGRRVGSDAGEGWQAGAVGVSLLLPWRLVSCSGSFRP